MRIMVQELLQVGMVFWPRIKEGPGKTDVLVNYRRKDGNFRGEKAHSC